MDINSSQEEVQMAQEETERPRTLATRNASLEFLYDPFSKQRALGLWKLSQT